MDVVGIDTIHFCTFISKNLFRLNPSTFFDTMLVSNTIHISNIDFDVQIGNIDTIIFL